jgi:hypothetical protein
VLPSTDEAAAARALFVGRCAGRLVSDACVRVLAGWSDAPPRTLAALGVERFHARHLVAVAESWWADGVRRAASGASTVAWDGVSPPPEWIVGLWRFVCNADDPDAAAKEFAHLYVNQPQVLVWFPCTSVCLYLLMCPSAC